MIGEEMTAQVALQSYQLFKNGDIEGLKALCHDDYTMTLNGMHRLSGTYRGAVLCSRPACQYSAAFLISH